MKVLRTPDERFADLEGYAFPPHYTEVKDEDGTPIRIHHVDEGPRDAAPILLMHGNPTWAYLYRKFIPKLAAAGHRVVAVDLVGCGRSDKPAERNDYTQARHVGWLTKWLTQMDLRDVTLFCQDWGFDKPFLTLFGAKDPVTKGGEKRLQEHVPGAAGQAHHVFPDASHFIQEDLPDELVERILAFVRTGG